MSLYLVIIISIVEFSIGILPVISCNLRKSVMDIIRGRDGRYKSAIMTKRKITTLRYFFRDNIPSEKTGIYLSIILIGITFMMLIQVNKYANVSFENDDEYDSQFDLLSDDISDMENFNKLIPETDYYDKVYITAGQFYLSRRRLPLL